MPGAGEAVDRQVFHGDRLVVADQRRGELVVKVAPRVRHPRMRPGDLDPGLVPVPASLLLTRQSALRAPELLLRPPQEPRGGDLPAVGQHREMGQPEVDAHHRSGSGKRARRGLHDEAREVPARRVPDHGHAGRPGRQFPGPAHRYVPDLRQPQLPVRQHLEPGVGGEPDRLPVILAGLEPGGSIFGPFRFPVTEAKKFRYAVFRSARACWSTTADTSPSQARSGLALAAVSRADNSASPMYGSPAAKASCRTRKASLNTTRAQPNALPKAIRCPGSGSKRYLYRRCILKSYSNSWPDMVTFCADGRGVFLPHARLVSSPSTSTRCSFPPIWRGWRRSCDPGRTSPGPWAAHPSLSCASRSNNRSAPPDRLR